MKFFLALLLSIFGTLVALAQNPIHYYAEINTSKGKIVVQLLNETPQHRDNFKKLVDSHFYDSLLFHRVIHNFMIQGGDPNSRNAADTAMLGAGGPNYKVPAEIRSNIFHVKGALGAARDNNPEKASSASQFYLVQGRKFSDSSLDSLEQYKLKGVPLSYQQREAYKKHGGSPHLDGNYTVFGKTIVGLEVIDSIAAVPTNSKDRPLKNEVMSIRMLTLGEAVNLERELNGLPKKKIRGASKPYTLVK